eukprot:NODE_165_length_16345_cov_0.329743.p3 type:complete len:393 gc:universal NODE_165_length_16345_cov_0.329743:4563-5741(+)
MVRLRTRSSFKKVPTYLEGTRTVNKSKLIPIHGRQKEIDFILEKCVKTIKKKSKLSLYISGQPGQGKTLSVNHSIQEILKKHSRTELKFISVNGMTTKKAEQIFAQMWRELTATKTRTGHKIALKKLEDWLEQPNRPFLLLLLDEIDGLLNTSQSTIYHIFEWIQKYDRFILISISNTFDLPEKVFKQKIVSRVGHERLDFNPYKCQELVDIATKHLIRSIDSKELDGSVYIEDLIFDKQALKLCGSKVASITSDARKMLNICDIMIYMAQDQKIGRIDMSFANKCLKSIFAQPCDQFLKSSIALNPMYEKVINRFIDLCDIKGLVDYHDIITIFWDVYAENGLEFPDESVIRQYIMFLLNTNVLQTDKSTALDHYSRCKYRWNGSLTFNLK